MTITVNKQEFAARFDELFALVEGGADVVVSDGSSTPVTITATKPAPARERILGMHPGSMTAADDFDEPMGDDFWGEEVS